MKFRLLSGIAITALMAGSALAADMPLKAAPPPVLTYDWSGFYIGGVIGGGWTNTDSSVPGLGVIGVDRDGRRIGGTLNAIRLQYSTAGVRIALIDLPPLWGI